ncbi:MAG: hypothetical protein PHW10_01070 [Candidatus Peribacteraceae bacterium]|nr:hypothetical protein [Candidatus Peribacteraceae bacterium]
METQNPPTPPLSWEAPLTITPERSKRWYVIGSAGVLGGAVLGFLTGNWSFAVTILLVGGAYFLVRNAPPVLHRISIEETGFRLDDAFTSWKDCRDFWLITVAPHTALHIQTKRRFNGEIVIQAGGTDPDAIRTILAQYLPERSNQKEHFTDYLIRIFKL